jgi:ribosomal protein S18 acetylase RimI-like enzyme
MILRDWCDLPGEALAPVYEAERRRWQQMLQWDSAAACLEVEHARVTWGLPGFVALDPAGRIRGMAYYLLEHDRVDIGGIVSDADIATGVLLDGIVTVARALDLGTVRMLTLDAAAALSSSLRMRGFAIEPHLYLSRSLAPPALTPTVEAASGRPIVGGASGRPGVGAGFSRPILASRAGRLLTRLVERTRPAPCEAPLDTWQADDVEPAAALLARSYDRASGCLFAPTHAAGEWSRYVRNLVTHVGCGILNPTMTQVLRDASEMRALSLVTDIAPGVAHLVQLAVDPSRRGARLGETLVQRSCDRLRDGGYHALTLLVASSNAPARALYDRSGFRHDATFLAATLDVRAMRGEQGEAALATA